MYSFVNNFSSSFDIKVIKIASLACYTCKYTYMLYMQVIASLACPVIPFFLTGGYSSGDLVTLMVTFLIVTELMY